MEWLRGLARGHRDPSGYGNPPGEADLPAVGDKPCDVGDEGRPFDSMLLATVIALVGIGVVMVYSASAVMTELRFGDSTLFVNKQLWHVVVGLVLMLVAIRVDYRWYKRLAYPLLGFGVALLLAVLLVGATRNEAQRWLSFGGFSFQPSEVVKIVLVIYMAYSLEKKDRKLERFSIGFIPHLMVLGLLAFLLLLQPDFGTTVICSVIVFTLLFVAGAKIGYIAMFGVIGSGLATWAVMTSAYRMSRVRAFLDPEHDPFGAGYQIKQSLTAIGSGGLFGKGLGLGHAKLGYVPELWNDFIATAIGEELGLVGLFLVALLFVALIWRGVRIAFGARDYFGTYLAFGLSTLFGMQAAINLSVVTGLLPNKGLTLPFISYGGSSMIISLFTVGVLLNISMAKVDVWEQGRQGRESLRAEERLERKRRRHLAAARQEGS